MNDQFYAIIFIICIFFVGRFKVTDIFSGEIKELIWLPQSSWWKRASGCRWSINSFASFSSKVDNIINPFMHGFWLFIKCHQRFFHTHQIMNLFKDSRSDKNGHILIILRSTALLASAMAVAHFSAGKANRGLQGYIHIFLVQKFYKKIHITLKLRFYMSKSGRRNLPRIKYFFSGCCCI